MNHVKRRSLIAFGLCLWRPIGLLAGPPDALPSPERDRILAQMAPIIARSVARRDTRHPVFHGCYDWHSAVHGHWALLRIARATGGYRDAARMVEESLAPERVAQEAECLRRRPGFEMPYGRAWFLRLAIEFELWADEEKRPGVGRIANPSYKPGGRIANPSYKPERRLRVMADETAASLAAHYEKHPPDANDREYENPCWALAQLHAYARHVQDGALRARAEAIIRGRLLEPAASPSLRTDSTSSEFFSRFGAWAYLTATTQDAATVAAWLRRHPPAEEDLRPVQLLPGAHHLGMTWSRAWALRALRRHAPDEETRQRLDDAFAEHVRVGMRQHAAHAGNYAAYDHWVPQFAVYAVTE